MNSWINILVMLIVAIGLFGAVMQLRERFSANSSSGKYPLEFKRKAKFFTKSELQYYGALLEALQGQFIVFPKVRLSDVLDAQGEKRYSHYSRIRAMHFDFLILSHDFVPLFALEIDGKSHSNQKQQKFDATKNEACRVAGFALERVHVGDGLTQVLTRLKQI
jgi:Protein of unknown function (DUF2726)